MVADSTTSLMAKTHLIKRKEHPLSSSFTTYPLPWSAIQLVSQLQPSLLPKAHSSKEMCLAFWPCCSLNDVCSLLENNHVICCTGHFEVMAQPTWLQYGCGLLTNNKTAARLNQDSFIILYRVAVVLEMIPADFGWATGTSWTSHQCIKGRTYRDKKAITLAFTLMDN